MVQRRVRARRNAKTITLKEVDVDDDFVIDDESKSIGLRGGSAVMPPPYDDGSPKSICPENTCEGLICCGLWCTVGGCWFHLGKCFGMTCRMLEGQEPNGTEVVQIGNCVMRKY